MLFGKYSITISNDGMVFLYPSLKDKIEVGNMYNVIVNHEDEEKEIYSLMYRFSNEVCEGEKIVKSYKVRKDKFLRVPPSYRELMSGNCFLIGLGNSIELVKYESDRKREAECGNMSFESIMDKFEGL